VRAGILEREAELSVLAAAVQDAAAGNGSVVLISGEAGIGKSSLVEAVRAQLPAEGRLLIGYCDDLATPRTLGPFRDLVGSVGTELGRALADGGDRDRLLAALRAELEWADHPAVLVVEDVHWADDATLDALRYLIRRIARLPADSTFTGSDYHEGSVLSARKRIADAGLGARVSFDVASAQDFAGGPFDLVTSFDCLHDMGDPLGAARHVRDMLAPDGTWMVVEPYAGGSITDNLNPVGRVYYSFSTFLCVPNALSQEGGYSLGAQAGEEPLERLAADAGFARFRRVAETPFNIVYEARR